MALNADNVHVGPARIFLGVTAPATGTPPDDVTHTAGVPADGTEVGFTRGDAVFAKNTEKVEIEAEQSYTPIMVFPTREIVEVRFTAMERVYNALRAAFDNVGYDLDANRVKFYSGGQTFTLRTQTVCMTSARPNQAGLYEISFIYKAYSVTGYETPYRKSDASLYEVTLRGILDTSRDVGDQAYQHYIEIP